jgi:hypothetical protein
MEMASKDRSAYLLTKYLIPDFTAQLDALGAHLCKVMVVVLTHEVDPFHYVHRTLQSGVLSDVGDCVDR